MILVYPVGIPVMFTYLLLMHRDKINPIGVTETVRIPMKTRVRPLNRNWSRIEPSDEVDMADVSVPAAPRTHRNTYEDDAVRERARSEVREPRAQHGLLPGGGGGGSGDQATPGETKCVTCENDTLYVVPSVDHNAHRKEVTSREKLSLCPYMHADYERVICSIPRGRKSLRGFALQGLNRL